MNPLELTFFFATKLDPWKVGKSDHLKKVKKIHNIVYIESVEVSLENEVQYMNKDNHLKTFYKFFWSLYLESLFNFF